MSNALERDFDQNMHEIYRRARKECRYTPRFFMEMLADYGGLETARRLLAVDHIQYGFTQLWECGRLDLTVEALVLRPEYRSLFTSDELNQARQRLRAYGYEPET